MGLWAGTGSAYVGGITSLPCGASNGYYFASGAGAGGVMLVQSERFVVGFI